MLKLRASTKLFLLICLGVVIAMLTFNLLMKHQLDEGKFVIRHHKKFNSELYFAEQMTTFQHVVINGIVRTHAGSTAIRPTPDWIPRTLITEDPNNKVSVELPRSAGSGVSLSVKNDTLFIAFNSIGLQVERDLPSSPLYSTYIKVKTPRLLSVEAVSAYVYLNGIYTDKPHLLLSHSIMSFNNVSAAGVNIDASDVSTIRIDKGSNLAHLGYRLCNSDVYIAKGAVNQFALLGMDNLSTANVIDTLGNAVPLKNDHTN